jgi:hypothetical protein
MGIDDPGDDRTPAEVQNLGRGPGQGVQLVAIAERRDPTLAHRQGTGYSPGGIKRDESPAREKKVGLGPVHPGGYSAASW